MHTTRNKFLIIQDLKSVNKEYNENSTDVCVRKRHFISLWKNERGKKKEINDMRN